MSTLQLLRYPQFQSTIQARLPPPLPSITIPPSPELPMITSPQAITQPPPLIEPVSNPVEQPLPTVQPVPLTPPGPQIIVRGEPSVQQYLEELYFAPIKSQPVISAPPSPSSATPLPTVSIVPISSMIRSTNHVNLGVRPDLSIPPVNRTGSPGHLYNCCLCHLERIAEHDLLVCNHPICVGCISLLRNAQCPICHLELRGPSVTHGLISNIQQKSSYT